MIHITCLANCFSIFSVFFFFFFAICSFELSTYRAAKQLLFRFFYIFLCAVYNCNDNVAGICIIVRERILRRDNSECVETTHHLGLMLW